MISMFPCSIGVVHTCALVSNYLSMLLYFSPLFFFFNVCLILTVRTPSLKQGYSLVVEINSFPSPGN